MMFEVYASTPENIGLTQIGEHARRAEAMGFDGLHVPDAMHDGLLLASHALQATRHLKVATGLLVACPRSPMTVAIAAWDLQAFSGGRFELGLGSRVKDAVACHPAAGRVGPVSRKREYIQALRAIFRSFQEGVALEFNGCYYQFESAQLLFNPGPIAHPHIPIYMGAIGPKMTQLAGGLADGMIAHPANTSPQYIRQVCLPRLRQGAQASDRDLASFNLTLATPVATGVDRYEVQQQRQQLRKMLGLLYASPAYWPCLELLGWPGLGPQLRYLSRISDWAGMLALVDDEHLDRLVVSGPYDVIAKRINQRYQDLANQGLAKRIAFPLPGNPANDKLAANTVQQLRQCA